MQVAVRNTTLTIDETIHVFRTSIVATNESIDRTAVKKNILRGNQPDMDLKVRTALYTVHTYSVHTILML